MSDRPGFLIGAPLAILLNRLQHRVMKGLAGAGCGDVSPAHLPVFQLLLPEGGRITDLARQAGTTKQAMGYLVAYLEKRGYLERKADPTDRRATLVVRTERGWIVNRVARDVVEEVQAEWAQLMGGQEMAVLVGGLRELVARLGVEYRGSVADPDAMTDGVRAGLGASAQPAGDD